MTNTKSAPSILWLGELQLSDGTRRVINALKKKGFNVIPKSITSDARFAFTNGTTTREKEERQQRSDTYRTLLKKLQEKHGYDLIVINNVQDLKHLIPHSKASDVTLGKYHGSLESRHGITFLVGADFTHLKHSSTINLQGNSFVRQIENLFNPSAPRIPKLDWETAETVQTLDTFKKMANAATLISIDIEVSRDQISCVGFSMLNPDRTVKTFVVPILDYSMEGGSRLDLDTEMHAWNVMREVCENDVPKVFANGNFDCQWLQRYGISVRHWWLDTQYVQHAYYIEAAKSLKAVSSYYNSLHCYWKDELVKSSAGDKYSVPETRAGMEAYLKYNAKDCLNTLYVAIVQWNQVCKVPWAYNNFAKIILPTVVGPTHLMNCIGMKTDMEMFYEERNRLITERDKLRAHWDALFPGVNPSSDAEVAKLLYKDLHATPIKFRYLDMTGKKDKKTLAFVAEQSYMHKLVVDLLCAHNAANKSLEYYQEKNVRNGSTFYKMSATGTKTMRYSSSESNFFIGRNFQNVPKKARKMYMADPGRTIVCADYSASDSWFMAFYSQDSKMMPILNKGEDMHLRNVEAVFGTPYEEGLAMKARGETKQRTTIKPFTHGLAYESQADTQLHTMGPSTVKDLIRLANLTNKDVDRLHYRDMLPHIEMLTTKYHEVYHELEAWKGKFVDGVARKGGVYTFFGGFTRRFQGEVQGNASLRRQILSTAGQGGTALNIINAMNAIFYSDLIERGVHMAIQVHDELVFTIPENKTELIKDIVSVMQQECEINGHKFTVPVDAEYGKRWAYEMEEYHAS